MFPPRGPYDSVIRTNSIARTRSLLGRITGSGTGTTFRRIILVLIPYYLTLNILYAWVDGHFSVIYFKLTSTGLI